MQHFPPLMDPCRDKSLSDKLRGSFIRNASKKFDIAFAPPHDDQNTEDDPLPETSLDDVVREIREFLDNLSDSSDKEHQPEIPNAADALSVKLGAMIAKYEAEGNSPTKFGKSSEDDSLFLEAVKQLSILNDRLGEFGPDEFELLNRIGLALQKAMMFLEEELRGLLGDFRGYKPPKRKSASFQNLFELDRAGKPALAPTESSTVQVEFPGFTEATVSDLSKIANLMIFAGYEAECCRNYTASRRWALKLEVNRLGFDGFTIDEVHRMAWENLEPEIAGWNQVLKSCVTTIFPAERKLSEAVFAGHPDASRREYSNLVRVAINRLLTFADAAMLTRRSSDKLFKFLDMYEIFRDVMPAIQDSDLDSSVNDLASEISAVQGRLGDAIVSIFIDLESSIKNHKGRTPFPSGGVHPCTRYTMSYLKNLCDYKDTLQQVLGHHNYYEKLMAYRSNSPDPPEPPCPNEDGKPKTSPLAVQLIKVLDILDENLDLTAKLYKDLALQSVFLMNNGRYIVRKIKETAEIRYLVGDNCYRRRSAAMRQHHKSYQRETWGRVLQMLSQEGMQMQGSNNTGKVCKTTLKERLKGFNAALEEIQKTQSTWVVSDEQLQSELRASISAVVIPAYRSFLARYQQYLDPGRQMEKYVKFQPEDIENLVEGLFEGTPTSMSRKKNLNLNLNLI